VVSWNAPLGLLNFEAFRNLKQGWLGQASLACSGLGALGARHAGGAARGGGGACVLVCPLRRSRPCHRSDRNAAAAADLLRGPGPMTEAPGFPGPCRWRSPIAAHLCAFTQAASAAMARRARAQRMAARVAVGLVGGFQDWVSTPECGCKVVSGITAVQLATVQAL
jgi:hypothetical protein